MKTPRAGNQESAQEDRWLERHLEGLRDSVHAPQGFARKVMDAVYRESLAGRPLAARPDHPARILRRGAHASSGPILSRMYRRLGLSFVLTGAVLAVSLLIPHGAYTTLIRSGSVDAGLAAGPSAAVQEALIRAGYAVQGALGEHQIGGNQQ
jgi:hypothetical protein